MGLQDTKVSWTQFHIMAVLALYIPTLTSNINSLKEYKSYAELQLDQDLIWILWPGPEKTTSHGSQGRSGHKRILNAMSGRWLFLRYTLYRPTSTSNINSFKEYESLQKWSWIKTWVQPVTWTKRTASHGSQGVLHKGILDTIRGDLLYLRYIDQHQHPTSTVSRSTKAMQKTRWNKTWVRNWDPDRRNAIHGSRGRAGHKGILDALERRWLFLRYIYQHQHPTSTVWKRTKAMQKWSWNKTWVRTCDLDQKNFLTLSQIL